MFCESCTNTRWRIAFVLAMAAISITCHPVRAQFGRGFGQSSVGGVKIDTDGVVSNPQVGELKELQSAWQKGLQQVPADLEKWTDLRFVSLKQLESEIATARAANKPLSDSVRFLAGLQRIRIRARLSRSARHRPRRSRRRLEGRYARQRCRRDQRPASAHARRPDGRAPRRRIGQRAAASVARSIRRRKACSACSNLANFPPAAARSSRRKQMEQAVGPQTITVTGIPATSHFARVIVAADFRMKRLAMNFEPAPVDGMPSFLTMLRGRNANNLMPRWWLAPNYEPLRRDADGLAWELRGQGVRCLTEQDFLDDAGQKQHSGKADPTAQKWADTFTQKFDELAREDSSLRPTPQRDGPGRRRRALGEGTPARTQRPRKRRNLMNDQPLDEYPAPRSVPSQASFVRAGRSWVVSVSGGVQIFPWQVADRTEVSKDLASTHTDRPATTGWYWQK